jgi:hypothetical protein
VANPLSHFLAKFSGIVSKLYNWNRALSFLASDSIIMRLIKALVGGIVSFFGILFSGLLDSVKSALGSKSTDDLPTSAPAPSVKPPADSAALPVAPPAPAAVPASVSTVAASVPQKKSAAAVASPLFASNQEMMQQPSRRPGPSLSPFMNMAKTMGRA